MMRAALRRELIVAIRRTALPVPASLVTLVLVATLAYLGQRRLRPRP